MSKENPDCIIATCPECKAVIFVCVNEPRVLDGEMFKDVAAMVKEGYSVNHVTLAEFRELPFGHPKTCSNYQRSNSKALK